MILATKHRAVLTVLASTVRATGENRIIFIPVSFLRVDFVFPFDQGILSASEERISKDLDGGRGGRRTGFRCRTSHDGLKHARPFGPQKPRGKVK